MDRRTFLETSTLIAGSGARGRAPRAARAEPPIVGIQVGAVSFVDEGTDKVLDGFQEMAGINTLFLATFTYGRGIAGRQLRGQPLPDHGKQEYDDNFRGGNFATPHPQYYRQDRKSTRLNSSHLVISYAVFCLKKKKKKNYAKRVS